MINVLPSGIDTNSFCKSLQYDAIGNVAGRTNASDVLSADVGIQMVQGTTGLATFNKEAWFDDFNVEVSEYDGAKKSREYTLAPSAVGGIISSRDTTSLGTFADYWYQYDAIGNVANRTNGVGASVGSYVQDAFGNVLAGGQGDGYHLTTKQFDADAGLYYFNARWYDPTIGRFTQIDPAEDGINHYIYVRNNPVNYLDPDGRNLIDDIRWVASGPEAGPMGKEIGGGFLRGGTLGAGITGAKIAYCYLLSVADGRRGKPETDETNALRHCILQCCLTQQLGAGFAKTIGDKHEGAFGDPSKDGVADDKNNRIGRGIGLDGGDCVCECKKAWEKGRLAKGGYGNGTK